MLVASNIFIIFLFVKFTILLEDFHNLLWMAKSHASTR